MAAEMQMRPEFERVGFVVTQCRGAEFGLEAPRRGVEFVYGETIPGEFRAKVSAGGDGVVIEMEHVSFPVPIRPVYGRTPASAAIAAWLAVEDWMRNAASDADDELDGWADWADDDEEDEE